MTADKLQIPQPGQWSFQSENAASGFDQHVREQLPWYDLMTKATLHVVRHYIPPKGIVYDFGCSTGNIGRMLTDTIVSRDADFRPVDNSSAMVRAYKGPGSAVEADMTRMPIEPFDVAICFLSLMFLPFKDRQTFLRRLRDFANPGGCIFVVDKMESRGGYPATICARLTLSGKKDAGVPSDEIIAKELSLMGVQRPLKAIELGGDAVQIFQWGEFAGFIIET